MRGSVVRWVAGIVLCALGCAAALVSHAGATASTPSAAAGKAAGTVETKLVLTRFTAAGKTIVGHGYARSTLRNAAGTVTSTSQKPFGVALHLASGPGPCRILYLELDELDLTLLGLRVHLRSATTGEPVKLTLSADSTHGVLGKLFCGLTTSTISTPTVAFKGAQALNKQVHSSTVMQAKATIYKPNRSLSSATANCQVLHLILGPLHLDLLGLIVDLNKIALDIEAIPGTTIGNLFCSLVPPVTTTAPGTTTGTTTTTP